MQDTQTSTLQVGLVEEIGGWGFTLRTLQDQINNFSGDNIELTINSFGGEYLEGLAIYNYLKSRKEKKRAKILAVAASAGTLVALGADEIEMPENGYFMIHNPWTIAGGDVNDMESVASTLEKFTQDLAQIYSKKTGLTVNRIRKMMDDETWLTSKEAKNMGFVDRVTKAVSAQASISPEVLAKFQNVPSDLLNKNKETMNSTNLFDAVKAAAKKLFDKDVSTESEAIEVLNAVELPTPEFDAEQVKTLATDVVNAQVKSAVDAVRTEMQEQITALDAKIKNLADQNNTLVKLLAETEQKSEEKEDETEKSIKALELQLANLKAARSANKPGVDTPPANTQNTAEGEESNDDEKFVMIDGVKVVRPKNAKSLVEVFQNTKRNQN